MYKNILTNGIFVLITSDNPRYPTLSYDGNVLAKLALINGTGLHNVTGKYDGLLENTLLVTFDNADVAYNFGVIMSTIFGQEAFILGNNGQYTMVYPRDTSQNVKGNSITWFDIEPNDYFTKLPNGKTFSINFDW